MRRKKRRKVHMFVDEKFYKKIEKAKKDYMKKLNMNKLAITDFTGLLAKGKVKVDPFGNGN